jgi:anti-sigma factor RsiW
MNECRRVRDLMGPYLYHALTDPERAQVSAHLSACSACRAEFADARAMLARLPGSLPAPGADAKGRIAAAVAHRWAQERLRKPDGCRPPRRIAGLAIGAAAVLALGLWIGYHLPHPTGVRPARPVVAAGAPTPTRAAPSQSQRAGAAPEARVSEAPRQPGEALPGSKARPARGSLPKPAAPQPHAAPPGKAEPAPRLLAPRPQGPDDVRLATASLTEMAP